MYMNIIIIQIHLMIKQIIKKIQKTKRTYIPVEMKIFHKDLIIAVLLAQKDVGMKLKILKNNI